uniref:NADH dehydrogenase subunit 5 n=1 Tax=Bipalium admarginatum TaxID=3023024 RepID=UPI0024112D0D|nr:NADH dehydrogenase subunit 5 [Bipalium admarginatum]WEM34729.1 NADH dehydrogenase subunit 5 [Bipalium admarginatum]
MMFDFSSIHFFDFFVIGVFLDWYSIMYLFILFMIVSSIHLFIYVYMGSDENLFRFFFILNLFVLSMVILLISPNLISLLLGWDGLGFSSFLLVAWFGCFSSRFASLKTFLINRLGDGLFLVSLYYFFFQGHFLLNTLDISVLVVFFFLLFAFFTKSAHFPFSSWLPDAMAAPTPVSALVHSSTLVTAGLYMLFRFSYLITFEVFQLIQCLGLWTLFIGSLGACFDQNSKKVVAYSTISQLGFISFILSLGCFDLSFVYMMAHALIKALLFISVGCFLVLKFHNQDFRHLNNCWQLSPVVTFNFFFSCFSLSGFPFLSAFYIKEVILGGVWLIQVNYFLLLVFLISLIFTIIYSFRLFFFIGVSFKVNYGVFVGYSNLNLVVFLVLYFGIIGLGVVIFQNFYEWLNCGSAFFILLYSLIGVLISNIIFSLDLMTTLKLVINYLVYMFFLNVITVSMNNLYVIGGFLINMLDSGFLLFSFIGKMNNIIKTSLGKILENSFFLNWLSLIGFSVIFVCCIIII